MIGANKVLLTQVLQSDLVEFIKWHQNPELIRQISDDLGEFQKPEDVVEFFLRSFRPPMGRLMMIKIKNSKGKPVPFGYIGARGIDNKNRKCSLSILVADNNFHKAGLDVEAINLFTDYLSKDLGLHRVDIILSIDYKNLIKAFNDAGFKCEANKLRGFWYFDGKYQDACLLSKFFTAL